MLPSQLKETTMDPTKRALLARDIPGETRSATTAKVVEQLMGNKPEERFKFISERAEFVPATELDV